jgi:hypothetical protein
MDFESLIQVFKFEVSRFPFASEERQRALRRAYRELEAMLRGSVRELEYGWGDTHFIPPRILSARLDKIAEDLQRLRTAHAHILSPEMRNGLETLCDHLRKFKEHVSASGAAVGASLAELRDGLEELKKSLGTVHRL